MCCLCCFAVMSLALCFGCLCIRREILRGMIVLSIVLWQVAHSHFRWTSLKYIHFPLLSLSLRRLRQSRSSTGIVAKATSSPSQCTTRCCSAGWRRYVNTPHHNSHVYTIETQPRDLSPLLFIIYYSIWDLRHLLLLWLSTHVIYVLNIHTLVTM